MIRMRNPILHMSLAVATGLLLFNFPDHAHAQSSLGIGTSEATIPSTGLFAHWLYWINAQQQAFYRLLTGALKAMRTDGSKLWVLVGLSFVYGIFHAAGPGHGKAVISSYMLANEVALRRGVMLSFVSAMLQALTAIVLMGAVFLVLRGTAISMTDASWALEIVSYAAISAFGAWLLWKKLSPYVTPRPAMHSLSAAHAGHGHVHSHHDHSPRGHSHDHHVHDHGHPHDHRHHHGGRAHDHGPGEVCETCGHSHAPDPALLSGDRFEWSTAWSAVAAVGIRPCSGALIVLTFAFLNGLWLGGILSVFAMAVGTAMTVAALATLAVTAKTWAVAVAGGGRISNGIHAAFEIGGAALVMLLGLVLLAASLAA
jgi:ABC-type nickel/cobalt efflux system permease component RcnA